MKPSRRRTLELKVTACGHCSHADRAKLRQKRDGYCGEDCTIRNGHCQQFEEAKPS